jgi:hypothetical protein
VHLAYAVFTVATTGSMREFGRGAAGLAAMKPAPALGVGGTDDADPALGAGDPAVEPYPSAEITFTVLRVMYAGLAAASDLLFLPQVAALGAPEAGIGWERPVVKMLKGLTGVASGVLLSTRSAWAERVNSLIGTPTPTGTTSSSRSWADRGSPWPSALPPTIVGLGGARPAGDGLGGIAAPGRGVGPGASSAVTSSSVR